MTALALRLTGARPKPTHAAALVLTAVVAVAAAAAIGRGHGVALLVLGVGTGAGLLLDVQLPRGGRVPLGHAVVIALAEILPAGDMVAVMALALAVAGLGRQRSDGATAALSAVSLFGASAVAAVAARSSFAGIQDSLWDLPASDSKAVLARVSVAGVVYLAVDLFGRGKLLARPSERMTAREVLPVYVTLVCASALLAITYLARGPYMAMIAAVPLLITRFSFERYSEARVTYQQTVQALSMIPEVAGLTPLGHGERTAVYAGALCDAFKVGPDRAARIVNVARLHHIGHISLHEPAERHGPIDLGVLAREASEILKETVFLADAAELVAEVQNPPTSDLSLDAAIVRVASALDDEIGDQLWRTRRGLVNVLAHHPDGVERRVAVTLLQVCEADPDLPDRARRAGEPLTQAARDHADHEDEGHGHEDHSHCV